MIPVRNISATGFRKAVTDLGQLSPQQLGVIARTSAMAYKHTDKTVSQIGRELGVDYILEGGRPKGRRQGAGERAADPGERPDAVFGRRTTTVNCMTCSILKMSWVKRSRNTCRRLCPPSGRTRWRKRAQSIPKLTTCI